MEKQESKISAWRLLLRTQSLLVERIEGRLRQAGLPPLSWYDVLFALDQEPSKRLRMQHLSDKMLLSRSNITRLADRLERKGLIRREIDRADRRGAFAVLTEEGGAVRKRMWPVYRQGIEEIFARRITGREAVHLEKVLANLLAALDDG